jgi:hypothetical protein
MICKAARCAGSALTPRKRTTRHGDFRDNDPGTAEHPNASVQNRASATGPVDAVGDQAVADRP